jgi:RNA polymerase sigma-70 factor (ECF subfamily)
MHAETFESMVVTHGGRMLAVARRIVRNEEDARDVVQDAYLSAFQSIRQFRGQSLLSTWLHRAVVNSALMRLRSRRRKPVSDSPADALADALADSSPAPDDLAAREQIRGIVRASIALLPGNYRDVLMLRDVEELSTVQTAERLGMTAAAVKVRLCRARKALAALLPGETSRPARHQITGREPLHKECA